MEESYSCPHCKNPIYDPEVLLCHFCGESLERAGKGFMGRVRYGNHKVVWFFVIFLILFSWILLFIR